MNVYQKVLVKLYEAADGRESKAVYLKDIVKDLGFLPSYAEIFSQMSHDGWITETSRSDEVNITPWGIRAVKDVSNNKGSDSRELDRECKKLKSEVKLLNVMMEELVADFDANKLKDLTAKSDEVSARLKTLKKMAK